MKTELKKHLALMVAVFLLFLGIRYWDGLVAVMGIAVHAGMPLIIGCIIAYAVNILMSFYEEKIFAKTKCKWLLKGKRAICMILAFVSLIAIMTLILVLVIPELINCGKYLIEALPKGAFVFLDALEENEMLKQYAVDLESMLVNNLDAVKVQIGEGMKSIFSGVGNVIGSVFTAVTTAFARFVTLLISFIFAIYLLSGKERLGQQFNRLLKTYLPKYQPKVTYVIQIFDECFHHFIVGQCIEAVILGSLCALGMTILQMPYALMIGTLIGFTALIPVAGAYIGAGVGAFMILTVSPVKAVFFLIFISLLQQIEGNVIYPRVVGNSIGLPGMWVLAAVTIGGGLLGVVGILFAVPFAASLYHLLQTDIRKKNNILKTKDIANVKGKKEKEK